jgi:hypothetical protein
MDYKHKYLKYKQKYNGLKSLRGGRPDDIIPDDIIPNHKLPLKKRNDIKDTFNALLSYYDKNNNYILDEITFDTFKDNINNIIKQELDENKNFDKDNMEVILYMIDKLKEFDKSYVNLYNLAIEKCKKNNMQLDSKNKLIFYQL